jgi:hypothetical protein
MPRTKWKVLDFTGRPQTPRYSNASSLPSSAQSKLLELVSRYDRLMKDRPVDAAEVLEWVEKILHLYGA